MRTPCKRQLLQCAPLGVCAPDACGVLATLLTEAERRAVPSRARKPLPLLPPAMLPACRKAISQPEGENDAPKTRPARAAEKALCARHLASTPSSRSTCDDTIENQL